MMQEEPEQQEKTPAEEKPNEISRPIKPTWYCNRNELDPIISRDLPNTLLTLLDDKNESIRSLKLQVRNQELQLRFYLHRVLSSPKISEFSETCSSSEVEDNIHINLAMTNFYKHKGVKSKILVLHQRMVTMEKRITRLTELQEDMVRNYLPTASRDSPQFAALIKILNSSNKLRRELDAFRTCCDRLITVEDERNGLVEQVYSTPVTQRMNYGILLSVLYEKMKLDKEVEEIRQEQRQLQERLLDLGGVRSDGDRILRVCSEPERTGESLEEIKLKEEMERLDQQVTNLQDLIDEKERVICELVTAKEDLEDTVKEVQVRLQVALEETDALREQLKQYSDIEDQVRHLRTQLGDVDSLRSQRDYYKAQVEDLKAVTVAYAQLLEADGDKLGLETSSGASTLALQFPVAAEIERSALKTTEVSTQVAFLNESELMRDCSTETIPITLPSLHRIENKLQEVVSSVRNVNTEVQVASKQIQADFTFPHCEEGQIVKDSTATVGGLLNHLFSELDETLARPGGRDRLLKTIRVICDTIFKETSPFDAAILKHRRQ